MCLTPSTSQSFFSQGIWLVLKATCIQKGKLNCNDMFLETKKMSLAARLCCCLKWRTGLRSWAQDWTSLLLITGLSELKMKLEQTMNISDKGLCSQRRNRGQKYKPRCAEILTLVLSSWKQFFSGWGNYHASNGQETERKGLHNNLLASDFIMIPILSILTRLSRWSRTLSTLLTSSSSTLCDCENYLDYELPKNYPTFILTSSVVCVSWTFYWNKPIIEAVNFSEAIPCKPGSKEHDTTGLLIRD